VVRSGEQNVDGTRAFDPSCSIQLAKDRQHASHPDSQVALLDVATRLFSYGPPQGRISTEALDRVR